MKAIIANFRGSRRTNQASNQAVIYTDGVESKEAAEKLLNKKVTWTNTKARSISGKITAVHGNSGAVRAIFEKGLPGQCLGKEVKIE